MKGHRKYTYLMSDGEYYKIGESDNPHRRLKQLKTANPRIKLICYGKKYTEKYLHKKFKKWRKDGEWFKLPRSEAEWIISNLGNRVAKKRYQVNKERRKKLKIKFEDYVIDFGKFDGIRLIDMCNDEQLRYCRWMFNNSNTKSKKHKLFKWWYFYKTTNGEIDLNFNIRQR